MPHAIVHLGDPEPRQVVAGIGGRYLLKGRQRLAVPAAFGQLNRGREVGGDVLWRGSRASAAGTNRR